LSRVGEQLIEELGASEFARRVLYDGPAAPKLVVDGVRHVAVHDALEEVATRISWYSWRSTTKRGASASASEKGMMSISRPLDRHSTERDVPLLREVAVGVVDGTNGRAAAARVRGASSTAPFPKLEEERHG
jgi:hypothetical protein